MKKPAPPPAVGWITSTLEDAGYETWAVGGAVRNALLGIPSGDWDLTTRAHPEQIQRLFSRTVPIGLDHGTVGVLSREGVLYEVTTFRRDVETSGRHAVVAFADTLDEDLGRRDFTINAMAWHPLREELYDPFDGTLDLERGVLRTVGEPRDRFAEDYLRILRALRFAGTYRLSITPTTWRALVAGADRTTRLSPERIRDELDRILRGTAPPSRSLALYAASGVLRVLLPELDAVAFPVNPDGDDWFSYSLRAVDCLSPTRPPLRWAALLQAVGEPGGTMNAGEEGRGAGQRALRRSAAVLERLRSSNSMIRRVAELTEWIAYPPATTATDVQLRHWLSDAGRPALAPLLRIWSGCVRAEARAGDGVTRPAAPSMRRRWTQEDFLILHERLRRIYRSDAPLAVGELALDGRDLIRLGFAPSPRFGEVLEYLLARVLDDPDFNRADLLREEAHRWMSDREAPRPPA